MNSGEPPAAKLGTFLTGLVNYLSLDRDYIAKRVNLTRSGLDHILGGNVEYPSAATVRGLADVFDISVLDIYANMNLTTDEDISRFVAARTQGGDTQDQNWLWLTEAVWNMTPEDRTEVVSALVHVVTAVVHVKRNPPKP